MPPACVVVGPSADCPHWRALKSAGRPLSDNCNGLADTAEAKADGLRDPCRLAGTTMSQRLPLSWRVMGPQTQAASEQVVSALLHSRSTCCFLPNHLQNLPEEWEH